MIGVSLKHFKNKSVLTVTDNHNNIIRKVDFLEGKEYLINPINDRMLKKRGRIVILKGIESTKYGPIAKVKYLDTLRPGKVEIGDLDTIGLNLVEVNDMDNMNVDEIIIDSYVFEDLTPMFQVFIDILNVINNKKDQSNIAYISQKEIADQISTSPSNVSKRIQQLIRYGSLEKLSSGVYKLLFNDIWHTPYRIVHMVILLVSEQPSLITLYKKQAELLNVSLDDIFQAWGYIRIMED